MLFFCNFSWNNKTCIAVFIFCFVIVKRFLGKISPTTEQAASSFPNTPISTSRPTAAASTMIFRSNKKASTNAASNSSRLSHLLIPTLEPKFAGLTKQGYPSVSTFHKQPFDLLPTRGG